MKAYFQDKVIWITGASSGIGSELAKQLSALGAKLILSARNEEKLNALKTSLKNPDNHMVLPFDLGNFDNANELVESIYNRYDKLHILFNNGGLSQRGEAIDTDLEVDRKIMEINYFGNIKLAKALLPKFRAAQDGQFVIISSIAGKFGFYWRSAYAASKHALQGFYESVLLEEAKNNIHVTLAYPGKINTPISESALNSSGEAHGQMDHNQETGMPVDVCVNKLLKAVSKKKKAVLIGNKEIWAVHIKRFSPKLFWKIIKKQSPV